MQSKLTAATCGLVALALSTAASAQAVGEFPAALDEANLRAWLAARTNMQPQTVVSIGSNSIIGIRTSTPDPAGPGRYKVQIRAEVINARTAAQGGYMSWSSDIDIDCTTRRSRALGITNYPARNLSGTGTVAGGPSANWVTPTIGTQLYSLVSAVCDQSFQRPLGGPAPVQTAAARPTPPAPPPATVAAVAPNAPQRTAPPPAPAPAATIAQAAPPLLPVKPFERPAEPSKMQVVVAPPAPVPTGDAARPPAAGPPPADFSPPPAPTPQVATAPPTPARARARPRGSSSAGVQVAAGESKAGVRSALTRVQRMSGEWAQLSAETVQANVGGRMLYRGILHGFASQGEANAMCERLKARGGACFVRQSWR